MDWMPFIATIVSTLAWPMVALVLVYIIVSRKRRSR